jgi:hypothetical protein
MNNDFYNQYKGLSKKELFQILLSYKDYQPAAVVAAKQVVADKNWTAEWEKRLEEENRKAEEDKEREEEDILEKAEYYRTAVKLKAQNNTLKVRIGAIPKFEAVLHDKNIAFFKEDLKLGRRLVQPSVQLYLFNNEDIAKVDEIARELGLKPNQFNIKPFWNFEVKAILIMLILIIIFLLATKK